MKTFKLPSQKKGDGKSSESNIRTYGEDMIRIEYPTFSFSTANLGESRIITGGDLEGTWMGNAMIKGPTYEEKTIHPYNPEMNYREVFSKYGYEEIGGEDDTISARTLRKWDWFENKCIIAYYSNILVEYKLDISKIAEKEFEVIIRHKSKSMDTDPYYAKYEKNHDVMNWFASETLEKQKQINERMMGLESQDDSKIRIKESSGFYRPINDNYILEQIGLETPLALGTKMKNIDIKGGFAIQQVAEDRIALHRSEYSIRELDRPSFINIRTTDSTSQFRFELTRIKRTPTTSINVEGDYIEKKIDVRDSVINRSQI